MDTGRAEVNCELLIKLISDIREALQRARGLLSKPFNGLGLYERLALRYS